MSCNKSLFAEDMIQSTSIVCPLCNDTVDKLLYRYHIDAEKAVIEKIKERNPAWTVNDGVCSRCVDYYHTEIIRQQRILPEIGPYFPVKSADEFIILPTPVRVDAHPRFTGKGVNICFIDSGFYPHPDLTTTSNRIKKMVDITAFDPDFYTGESSNAAWHGTMTSVVCAGDGYLSKGLYKGIACDAELVLIKVQDNNGRITTANIVRALEWVLHNHEQYNIRIVNMSLSGDDVISYKESEIDILAEQLIEKGIVIIAAVGNNENGEIRPPANALNVVAVGGIDDDNILDEGFVKAYHSTYGITIDALQKPEMVAHAIWISAPILPSTKEQEEAAILYKFSALDEQLLLNELKNCIDKTGLDKNILHTDISAVQQQIINRIQRCKYISADYMHVDGTSFAAPIISAVVAQLLEANKELTAHAIREILFSTAKRIEQIAPERQGFGIVQPRKAILKILKKAFMNRPDQTPHINREKNIIEFYIHNECAQYISLAGSFNNWAQDVLLLEPGTNGIWKIEIPLLKEGKYSYKFFIDGKYWMEDVHNPFREPDGFNGFNSLLIIQN